MCGLWLASGRFLLFQLVFVWQDEINTLQEEPPMNSSIQSLFCHALLPLTSLIPSASPPCRKGVDVKLEVNA